MPSFMYKNEKIGGVTPKQENIRMGSADISAIGDGTLTGAIESLDTNKLNKTANAASASKLSNTSAIGSATKPVYFNANGVPVAGTYELNKTVPSDAKFTDTTYSAATTSATGLMSATDKSKLDTITVGYLTMGTLGLKGKTSSVADFFSALVAKGYDKLGVLHFFYDNANAGNITGSDITISINGCQCILTTRTDAWNRKNAIISITGKTYNVWAQYDNGTSPSNSGIFDLTSAIKLQTARTIQTKLNSTSSASFDGTGNVTPGVAGTLPVANGGTGQTTLNAGANAFINSLDTGTATPVGDAYFVSQDASGGNNNTYFRRPISTIWGYIKGQIGTKGSATQPIYMNGGVPTACTYSLNKTVPSNAVFTDTNTWRPVQNNLTSTSTSDCLSAYQGKLLSDRVATLESTSTKKLTNNSYIRKKGNVVSFYSWGGASDCNVLSSITLESTYRPPYPIHIAGYICGVGSIRRYPAFLSIGSDGVMGVYFMNQFGGDATYYTDANWWFDGNGTWLV